MKTEDQKHIEVLQAVLDSPKECLAGDGISYTLEFTDSLIAALEYAIVRLETAHRDAVPDPLRHQAAEVLRDAQAVSREMDKTLGMPLTRSPVDVATDIAISCLTGEPTPGELEDIALLGAAHRDAVPDPLRRQLAEERAHADRREVEISRLNAELRQARAVPTRGASAGRGKPALVKDAAP